MQRDKENGLTLKFYSKDIAKWIHEYLKLIPTKTYHVKLKKELKELSEDFLKYFVRGIIDTDGHHKKDGRIVLCLVSKEMVEQVSVILKELKIENKIYIRNRNPPEVMEYELTIPKRYT